MKRLCICMCVVAVLGTGCGKRAAEKPTSRLSVWDKMTGTHKTAREKAGLIGPVHIVRTEKAVFVKKSGQWVEGPREPVSVIAYTTDGKDAGLTVLDADGGIRRKTVVVRHSDGRLVESLNYREGGALTVRHAPSYDNGGNPVGIDMYNADGSLGTRIVQKFNTRGQVVKGQFCEADGSTVSKESRTYDADGNLIEVSQYDASGKLHDKTETTCFTDGNGFEQRRYNSDGSLRDKRVSRYDAKWNLIEKALYGPDGSLESRIVYSYDDKGNAIEEEAYLRPGPEAPPATSLPRGGVRRPYKRAYTYEFDEKGNWVKQTTSEWVTENGKKELRPISTTYRTITYYQPGGRKSPSH